MTGAAENHVRVTLELLHDLLGLQIPDIHLVVFAAAHDPLAARDGKVGEDTVFLVFVPLIRLQTFALGVVPQLESVVQRGGQDVLAVGRKLDETHRRIVVVNQRLQTLPTR